MSVEHLFLARYLDTCLLQRTEHSGGKKQQVLLLLPILQIYRT